MCAGLGITIIPANSPLANGRIERASRHQNRFVKKPPRLVIADSRRRVTTDLVG